MSKVIEMEHWANTGDAESHPNEAKGFYAPIFIDWGKCLNQAIHQAYKSAGIKSAEASRIVAVVSEYYERVLHAKSREHAFAECIRIVLDDLEYCQSVEKPKMDQVGSLQVDKPWVRAFDVIVSDPHKKAIVYRHLSNDKIVKPMIPW